MPWVLAAVPAILSAVGSAAGAAGTAAAGAIPAAAGALGSAASAVPGLIGSAASSIGSGLASAGEGVLGALESAGSSIGNALGFGGEALPEGITAVGPETALSPGESALMLGDTPFTATGGADFAAQGVDAPLQMGGMTAPQKPGIMEMISKQLNPIGQLTDLLSKPFELLMGDKKGGGDAPGLASMPPLPAIVGSIEDPARTAYIRALAMA